MGVWFTRPLGDGTGWAFFLPTAPPRDEPDRQYLCARCGAPLVPCDRCGRPSVCGDAWCEMCQPGE